MEVTDNTKTLANALAEIEQLRKKLEEAEEANSSLLETLSRRVNVIDTLTEKLDKAETIIREAQEQKPSIFVVFNGVSPVKAFYENSYAFEYADSQQKNHSLSGSWSNFHVKGLYAAPVPAMPIQDDKWVTITNEEWNIPKLGQRVIVCIDGVVQNVPVKLDQGDNDFGCGDYFWSNSAFDECPTVKAGDSWMPWPTKPQSEVKPS